MNLGYSDSIRAALKSDVLVDIPMADWPPYPIMGRNLRAAWVSRDFMVQVAEEGPHLRLSFCRTDYRIEGEKLIASDGISWDDLQRLKSECGYGATWAVEVYPADDSVVNHANMRHLWVVPRPDFAWGKDQV